MYEFPHCLYSVKNHKQPNFLLLVCYFPSYNLAAARSLCFKVTFANKGPSGQGYGFSSGLVWM